MHVYLGLKPLAIHGFEAVNCTVEEHFGETWFHVTFELGIKTHANHGVLNYSSLL